MTGASRAAVGQALGHGRRVAGLLRAALRSLPPEAELSLDELPWVARLDETNVRLFIDEYASAYAAALEGGDWQRLDDLLGEWQATAEALDDPELVRLFGEGHVSTEERVPLDYPE
jgi:hypothetical protein